MFNLNLLVFIKIKYSYVICVIYFIDNKRTFYEINCTTFLHNFVPPMVARYNLHMCLMFIRFCDIFRWSSKLLSNKTFSTLLRTTDFIIVEPPGPTTIFLCSPFTSALGRSAGPWQSSLTQRISQPDLYLLIGRRNSQKTYLSEKLLGFVQEITRTSVRAIARCYLTDGAKWTLNHCPF